MRSWPPTLSVCTLVPSTKADGLPDSLPTQPAMTNTTARTATTRASMAGGSSAQPVTKKRDVVLAALVGRFADNRRARRPHHRHQQVGIDLPGAEVGVPVAARPRRVLGVVAVHQVDAAGDALDALDGVDQRLARRPGVAGIQAEADTAVADVVPKPSDGVEVTGHRVITAGGVLQVDRNFRLQLVERLTPALEAFVEVAVLGDVAAVHDHRGSAYLGSRVTGVLQDFARRDPHPVVR